MSEKLRQAMARRVEEVFTEQAYPGDENIVAYYGYKTPGYPSLPEEGYVGQDWRTMSLDHLVEYRDYIVFLSPEAFRYFLPGFLIASLLHPDESDTLVDNVVGALTPLEGDPTHCLDLAGVLNAREKAFILEFLENYTQLFSEDKWCHFDSDLALLDRGIKFWEAQTD